MLLRTFVTTLICLSLSQAVHAKEPVFKLVTENLPPFNYSVRNKSFEHKQENIKGISVEIITELFKRTGFNYSLKLRQWNLAYSYAQRKPYRGVFGTVKTKERSGSFQWVGPLLENNWVVFAKNNFKGKITNEHQLKNYEIGGYKGDIRVIYLKSKGFNVTAISNDRYNPQLLDNELIDLWVSGGFSGPYLAKLSKVNVKPVYTIRKASVYLAMNKNTPKQYINALNAELKNMRNDGFIDRVMSSHKEELTVSQKNSDLKH
ncbi:substrate-binding periplasmic protein [Zooshikella harenae]|uniref:ABC transporter substrate-binding protein n=1 Tax=Zooshikella harenae TaxID=2827238 RepID=A0ABS5ZJE6_9GAMM|nr:ABC transporter substrate-binding protein [Zooshikella harenae]MBU2713371.1 ABC transporter substrate-binding protein [Zooshikella harenae]